ncbi:MAG: archaetidylserine decarboxylase [Gammaproteobacteria bacterium]
MNAPQHEPHAQQTEHTENKPSWSNRLFILLQHLLPRLTLSRLMGTVGDCQIPWVKNTCIDAFRAYFPVNLSEALEEEPHAYDSFNAFFARALKPEARPFIPNAHHFLSPCDGVLLTHGSLSPALFPTSSPSMQVKNHTFTLNSLLAGEASLLARYQHGHYNIIYLAPHHYHRIHMPLDGTLLSMIHVPGTLYSVNDVTVSGVPGVFARNERVICTFDTAHGLLTLILVGALIVGSIATPWAGIVTPRHRRIARFTYDNGNSGHNGESMSAPIQLKQGEEMGRFLMGSTVIALSESSSLTWARDQIKPGAEVRLGQRMGQFD